MNERLEKNLGSAAREERLSKMEGGFSPEVQQVLARTRREGGFSPEQYRDIEAAIASSPYLHSYLDRAAKDGDLEVISWAGNVPGMAGFYDERNRSIQLTVKAWGEGDAKRKEQLDVLTGTLGHEAGHAIQRREAERAWGEASTAVRNASLDAQPDHTKIAEKYIGHMRHDEAKAEIHAWNAVNSRVRKEMGDEYTVGNFLQRVAATTHCTEGKPPQPASGLQLSPEGYLQMEGATQQATIDAVARCHFDRPAAQTPGKTGLGEEFNYRNYYAAAVVNLVAHYGGQLGASKVFRADMERLGAEPGQMERAGVELGGQGRTLRYENLRGERIIGSGLLHDLGRGRAGPVPDVEVKAPGLDNPPGAEVSVTTSRKAPGLDDPSHPQHSLYRKIQQSLPPETSADRLAQIVAHAHAEGMREDKDVRAVAMVGATVHVLSQTLGFRSETDLSQPPPGAEQSRQQVETQQQQAEQALQQQAQQREQQREQQQQQHSRSLH